MSLAGDHHPTEFMKYLLNDPMLDDTCAEDTYIFSADGDSSSTAVEMDDEVSVFYTTWALL